MGWLIAHYAVDAWSLVHVAVCLAAGLLARRAGVARARGMLGGLLVGMGWELLELLVVEGLVGFHEPILNRLLDLVFDLAGFAAAWVGSHAPPARPASPLRRGDPEVGRIT